MSVIVWDGKSLAADRQATLSDGKIEVCKIRRISNGCVIAATGDFGKGIAKMNWYENGADPLKWSEIEAGNKDFARLIVAFPNGTLVYYDDICCEIEVFSKFVAFGAGRDYAMGALSMGASANRAAWIACEHSTVCGLGVDCFEVVK